MLTVLTSRVVHPEIEPIDRDPGIVTLLSGMIRFARRVAGGVPDRVRAYRRVADRLALFSSASARPHTRN